MILNMNINNKIMSNDLDILAIDANIRKNLNEQHNRLSEYQEKLLDIDNYLENNNLRRHIRDNIKQARNNLYNYVKELTTQENYNFYLMESLPYIEQYKNILKTPIKVSFMGKSTENNKEKKSIIEKYLEIAKKYVNIDIEQKNKVLRVNCTNCPNKKDFDIIDNNTYVCKDCYAKQRIVRHNSSYNDIDRVNISSKYMYDPKIHFRDCMKQYQGKQNCTIPQKVYKDLEEQFERHHLLKGDENTAKCKRFEKITKNHIMIFLKELGYPKQYENIHLIHYNFTDIKPEDISYLEDQLLDDFDRLISLYQDKYKNIQRKNFINTQYVLYQLLRHHKHPCKNEDFAILKTIDRQFFHDDVCKNLFEDLGWNHFPYY